MTPDNPEVTMVWQPIETAPRDGTLILAYDGVSPKVCSWGLTRKYDDDDSTELGWRLQWDLYPMDDLEIWTPLPPLPALSEGEKGGGE